MKRLKVRYHEALGQTVSVGELAEDRGRFYFEFDESFLTHGFPLSPFKLPVVPGLQTFQQLPGVFDDALPDGWGRLLMDRYLRQNGYAPATFTELDRLAWMGEHALGALSFYPASRRSDEDVVGFELGRLAREAQAVLEGDTGLVLPELLQAGGSPGGARPKILAGVCGDELVTGPGPYPDRYEPWLIKFFARTDPPDTGAVEEAYARMAQAAGIAFPDHKLFEIKEGRFFGVRRFDREGLRRLHMHSLGNLIGANFRTPCLDYQDVHKVVRLLTENMVQVRRVYRLMVFNVLSHNRDDHVKNFAFLYKQEEGWLLAPGFDLTFTEGPGGEHTTSVCGEGRAPGKEHFLRIAEVAGIGKNEALQIVEEVHEAVSRWPSFARDCGVRKSTSDQIWLCIGNAFKN
jgi:serine/threonine-protein kinase HipA